MPIGRQQGGCGKEPEGMDAFDDLARKLVKVPKQEIEHKLMKKQTRARPKKNKRR